MAANKAVVERVEQLDPIRRGRRSQFARHFQILDAERVVRRAVRRSGLGPDDERGVLWTEKTGRVCRRAERAKRCDAHKAGQLVIGTSQLFGHQRAERWIADRSARQVAGVDELGGLGVVSFLAGQRAENGQFVRPLGKLGQMLADSQAGHARGDFLDRATVLVARLEVERIELARAATHPEQNARPAAGRVGGDRLGQSFGPAAERAADCSQGRQSEPICAA